MKKLFIFLTVSLFAVSAFAQFEQGTVRIGGASNLGFSNEKFKGADWSTNTLSLEVGGSYFFINNLAADVELGFDYTKDSDEDDAASILGLGLGVRYYLPVNVFVGAGFDIASFKWGSESVSGTGLTLKAGYAAFLSDNIALEPSIGYRIGLSDEDKGTQLNGLYVKVGFSIFF